MLDPFVTWLIPHNFHTWKAHMTRVLMSRGLWSCLDASQPILTHPYEVLQHKHTLDEAMGLITLNILDSVLFHLDGLTTLRAI